MKKIYTILLSLLALFASAQPIGDARQTKVSATAGGCSISGEGFTIRDVGKTAIIHQAGAQGDELTALITGYVSATTLTLNAPAANMVTNAVAWIGTDNTPVIQSQIASNTEISFTPGKYLFSGKVNISVIENMSIKGVAAELLWISANPNSYYTGAQPLKDLFKISYSKNISFDHLIFRNIGQEQPRTSTAQEGGHYTSLGGVAVSYSRHFNKKANTGACVYNTASERISVTNCEAYRVGCFYVTSGAATGCHVTNNYVKGYGSVAFFPGAESLFSGNSVDNSEASAVTDSEANQGFGTSHAYYITGGFDGVKIIGETVTACRHYAVQFNTSSGNPSRRSTISDCHFNGCEGWLYVAGNGTAFTLLASKIIAVNSKSGSVSNTNAVVLFSDIVLDNSTITVSTAKYVGISNVCAMNLPFSNISAVYVVPYNIGRVRLKNCTFSETVATAIYFHGDGSNITSLEVQDCTFNCISKLGYSGLTPISGAAKKIVFSGCRFYGEGLSIYLPCRVINCEFYLVDGIWGITVLQKGTEPLKIEHCVFITDYGPYCINLSPMPAGGKCEVVGNDFGVGWQVNFGAIPHQFSKNVGNLWQ